MSELMFESYKIVYNKLENEDKPMKVRIKTDQFKGIELNEIKDYKDLTPLQNFCVDNEYPAFEVVEEIVDGDWVYGRGSICGHYVYRKGSSKGIFVNKWGDVEIVSYPDMGVDDYSIRPATMEEVQKHLEMLDGKQLMQLI